MTKSIQEIRAIVMEPSVIIKELKRLKLALKKAKKSLTAYRGHYTRGNVTQTKLKKAEKKFNQVTKEFNRILKRHEEILEETKITKRYWGIVNGVIIGPFNRITEASRPAKIAYTVRKRREKRNMALRSRII